MRASQQGFTITEVLVATVLFAIMIALILPLFLVSIRGNQASRQRTNATSVAESWLDRYRSKKEPLIVIASGPCAVLAAGVGVTCTYAADFDYATDKVPSHLADSAAMKTQFGDYTTIIQATRINSGVNAALWEIKASVQPKPNTPGGDQVAVLTTRVTQ
jgi:prepilin-type N-terminal cleavage/methylation domain-containing protein